MALKSRGGAGSAHYRSSGRTRARPGCATRDATFCPARGGSVLAALRNCHCNIALLSSNNNNNKPAVLAVTANRVRRQCFLVLQQQHQELLLQQQQHHHHRASSTTVAAVNHRRVWQKRRQQQPHFLAIRWRKDSSTTESATASARGERYVTDSFSTKGTVIGSRLHACAGFPAARGITSLSASCRRCIASSFCWVAAAFLMGSKKTLNASRLILHRADFFDGIEKDSQRFSPNYT